MLKGNSFLELMWIFFNGKDAHDFWLTLSSPYQCIWVVACKVGIIIVNSQVGKLTMFLVVGIK